MSRQVLCCIGQAQCLLARYDVRSYHGAAVQYLLCLEEAQLFAERGNARRTIQTANLWRTITLTRRSALRSSQRWRSGGDGSPTVARITSRENFTAPTQIGPAASFASPQLLGSPRPTRSRSSSSLATALTPKAAPLTVAHFLGVGSSCRLGRLFAEGNESWRPPRYTDPTPSP